MPETGLIDAEIAAALIARFTHLTDSIFKAVNILQRQTQNIRRTRDLLLPRLPLGQVPLTERVA